MSKIIYLYSDTKSTERAFYKMKTCFPSLEIEPIIVLDTPNVMYVKDTSPFKLIPRKELFKFVRHYDFVDVSWVIISFMTDEKLLFVLNTPKHVKIGWGIQGGDLYNRYLNYHGYELRYQEHKATIKSKFIFWIKSLIRKPEFKYLISRVSFVSCCGCDYEMIKKYSTSTKLPDHVYSFAYPMDQIMGDLYKHEFQDGYKIIVGNSASKTNNHLYALNYLRDLSISDFLISLQLSYGDSDDEYKQKVIERYSESFPNKVEFITTFVPLDEYHKNLLNGYVFIYGNWRQEAVGNILVALYLGAKVYLSNKNPLLDDFRNQGFYIFELETIKDTFHTPMTIEMKQHNRSLSDSLYNYERGLKLYKEGYSRHLIQNEV